MRSSADRGFPEFGRRATGRRLRRKRSWAMRGADYACGPVCDLMQEWGRSVVVTFKDGRTPALWREYQLLRAACPENVLTRTWGDGRVQEFRWVLRLDYEDSDGRWWKLNALECTERTADKGPHYFAWLTGLPLGRKTVEE